MNSKEVAKRLAVTVEVKKIISHSYHERQMTCEFSFGKGNGYHHLIALLGEPYYILYPNGKRRYAITLTICLQCYESLEATSKPIEAGNTP